MFSTIRNTLVTGPRQRNVALAEFLTNNGKHFRQILSVEKAQVQSGNKSIHEAWFGRTWPTASDGSCIPKEASASKKASDFSDAFWLMPSFRPSPELRILLRQRSDCSRAN